MTCPEDNVLHEFALGALVAPRADDVASHLDACAICRRAVSALIGTDDGTRSAPGSEPARRIGRFEIADLLGAGGMGMVYRAFDPELGRMVALKLVRRSTPEAYARQQREARAMAQITHPNVVAIHDVGTDAGELFLVMELVAGTTLADWLHSQPRSWREIVAMFVAAGRGLAAAHAAGLVHRDFKPHNVLVGDDGRVCVTDFGLARESSATTEQVSPVEDTSPAIAMSPLTSAGRVLGTPAYMAPEQHLGAVADARSDQFAFAIALWEALYGERPFAGATAAEIGAEVVAGRVRTPREQGVPAFIRRALSRCLSADPARRWPSIDALLAALSAPRRIARRIALGALALGGLAIAAITWGQARARAATITSCASTADELAGVWDASRERDVDRAVLATGLPYAKDAARRVEAGIDRFAAGWRSARVQACEDTRVRQEASDAVLDNRERCLAHRRIELRALVDVLARADAGAVERAGSAIDAISSEPSCLDVDAPVEAVDSAHGGRVGALWERYASAAVSVDLGRYRAAADEARASLADAKQLDVPPLTFRLAQVLGVAAQQLGDLPTARVQLTAAAAEAERAHAEALRTVILAGLVVVLANDEEHADEVTRWSEVIRGGMMRLPPPARCTVARELVEIADLHPSLDEATRAAKLCESLDPPNDAMLSDALAALAEAQYNAGRVDDALTTLRRALMLGERGRGPDHPDNAELHVSLSTYQSTRAATAADQLAHARRALEILDRNHLENATTEMAELALYLYHLDRGEYGDALAYARRERETCVRIHGANSARVAWAMNGEVQALTGLDRLDEALHLTRDERALFVARVGEGTEETAAADADLGEILWLQGRPREALPYLERATTFLTAHSSAATVDDVIVSIVEIGDIEMSLGDHASAMRRYEQGLSLAEHRSGNGADTSIEPLTGIGETLLADGRARDALVPLERAVGKLDEYVLEPIVAARARFALARALWDSGGDHRRALELAHTADDEYTHTTNPRRRERLHVEAWLAGKHIAGRDPRSASSAAEARRQ